MTKSVFTNTMLAHVWAQLKQPHGRNASNSMSFDGAVAYSYREPVAHIVETKSKAQYALITSNRYSVTTSGHVSDYRCALKGEIEQFLVPDLLLGMFHIDAKHSGHAANLAHFDKAFAELLAELMRSPAGSSRIEGNRPQHALLEIATRKRRYTEAFGLRSDVLQWGAAAAVVTERRDRLLADPKRAAKLAAGLAARERKEAAYQAEVAEAHRQRQLGAIVRWESGFSLMHFDHLECAEGGALLRLSTDGTQVQTSWGAEVPVADARRVLSMYDYCRAHGKVIEPADDMPQSRHLGHFTLDCINADGSIKVGCHTIYASQIEHLRALLTKI